MNRAFKTLGETSGFSLVEVLVAAGLLCVVALGSATLMSQMNENLRRSRSIASKDSLATLIRQAAGSASAILESARHNGALRACVDPLPSATDSMKDSSGPCGSPAGKDTAFDLYSPVGDRLSGSYNYDGQRCGSATDPGCYLLVQATFAPDCSGCEQIDSLTIRWSVKNMAPQKNPMKNQEGQTVITLQDLIRAAGSLAPGNMDCPSGQVAVGILSSGMPHCVLLTSVPVLKVATSEMVPLGEALCDAHKDYCDVLYGNVHRTKECGAIGGAVADAGGKKLCRLSGNKCPSGWTRLDQWGSTQSASCSAHSIAKCPNPLNNKTQTDSHTWQNQGLETAEYYSVSYNGGACDEVKETCYSTLVEVGCY